MQQAKDASEATKATEAFVVEQRARMMTASEERAWRTLEKCPWCSHGDEPVPGSAHAAAWLVALHAEVAR